MANEINDDPNSSLYVKGLIQEFLFLFLSSDYLDTTYKFVHKLHPLVGPGSNDSSKLVGHSKEHVANRNSYQQKSCDTSETCWSKLVPHYRGHDDDLKSS